MSSVTFDSHGFVKELIRVKVPEEQAEVFAKQYSSALDGYVATKSDIELLRKDIELARANMATKADLANLKTRQTRFIVTVAGFIIAAVGLMFAYWN